MNIRVEKKLVRYRKWGVPESKLRVSIYADDVFIGNIMATPEVAERFLTLLMCGVGEDGKYEEIER